MNTLLMRLPNLLDSRVPDGDGEDDNVLVTEWGLEYIHSGKVRTNILSDLDSPSDVCSM